MKSKSTRFKTWDWLSAFLLLFAIYLASLRLSATDWVDNLSGLHAVVLIAGIVGMALGRTRLHGLLCILLALLSGAVALLLQLGLQVTARGGLLVQVQNALQRLQSASVLFINGSNVPDAIFFLALMGLIFWLLGVNAGFRMARRNDAWGAALPFLPLFITLQYYDGATPTRIWYLGVFMLVVLLLATRLRVMNQQNIWKAGHLKTPMYLGADMLVPSFSIVGLLVLVAWAAPPLEFTWQAANEMWSDVTKPWREVRNDLSRAFYAVEGTELASGDYYAEALSLGNGNQLSPNIIFTVEVLSQEHHVPRFYWRDRIYDLYIDGEWSTTFSDQDRLSSNANYGNSLSQGRMLARFNLTTGKSIRLLHTAPQLISLSRSADASYTRNQDGSIDVAALQLPTELSFGEQYVMESAVTSATVSELRAAGTVYPAWVSARYLQVPDGITQRTRDLALQIAGDLQDPYDIAAAITSYLRTNIEYQPSLPLPPVGAEPVDWMLFDQKQAFCNYYATAEVILLRSLGIPARMAVGYAQGGQGTDNLLLNETKTVEQRLEEDLLRHTYFTVRERDAHAWPEVFFPGIGWVEFEPTANQQELIRPQTAEEVPILEPLTSDSAPSGEEDEGAVVPGIPAEEETTALDDPFVPSSFWQPFFWILAFVAVVAASFWWRQRERVRDSATPAIKGEVDEWETRSIGRIEHWNQTARQPALTRAYLEINSALRRLGAAPKAGDTASARADALSKQLPKLREQILTLSGQYQAGQYSRSKSKQKISRIAIWHIRWSSFWLGLGRRLTSPKSLTGRFLRLRRRVNRQFGQR